MERVVCLRMGLWQAVPPRCGLHRTRAAGPFLCQQRAASPADAGMIRAYAAATLAMFILLAVGYVVGQFLALYLGMV